MTIRIVVKLETPDSPASDPPQAPPKPLPPTCRTCNTRGSLQYVKPDNPNGNAGRPYSICPKCPPYQRWLRWEDARGIHITNPPCHCGKPSRQDRIGRSSTRPGKPAGKAGWGFWTCAEGVCRYYSEVLDGDVQGTAAEGERFIPWLLLGMSGYSGSGDGVWIRKEMPLF
ncbi:hypothetical protein BD289DRAFT_452660 [Coniella lustricola]|uniref:GRF-like zinc ribbon domain-containing protein n=1 Tax=Coniella lustricola TaxID=2025994 RepID=A0A2T3AAB5_9PEZI|nr:hypothetical protein BD289DRAFT_452660 [Coniella lustricola]